MYAYDYPINVQGNSHGRCLVEGSASANSSRASTRSSRNTNEPSADHVSEMQLGIAIRFEIRSETWRRYASDKRKARCGARLRPTAT